MAEASLKLGGSWATKEGSLLGFNDENGNYKPIPFDFTRATTATRINRDGLIEEVQSGVPRIDFTDSAGSLLLEPQRTNLVTYSEDFSQWSLNTSGISSIEANYAASPEGLQNAYKVNFIVQSDSDLSLSQIHPITGGSTYVYSIYIKGEGTNIGKDVVIKSKRHTGDSAGTTTTQTLTNEWKRIDFTTTYAANNINGRLLISSNDATSCLVYGAQVELGSYPTSYIPTSGSAVTRNGDFCEKTSASSYIGQTEGTMYWEGSFQPNSNPILLQLTPDSGNYTHTIYIEYANSSIRMRVYDSGTQQAFFSVSATAGTEYKIALAYKENDIKGYVNGASIGTDTSATIQSGLNNIYVGKLRGTTIQDFNGTIPKQVILYKTRLSNTELAELTTI